MSKIYQYISLALLLGLSACSNEELAPVDNEGLLPKPTALFSYEVPDPSDPFTIKFDNKSTNYAISRWSFADDSTSSDVAPTHTFLYTGSFNVKLISLNEENYWAQREETIVISPSALVELEAVPSGGQLKLSYNTVMNIAQTSWWVKASENSSTQISSQSTASLTIAQGEFVNAGLTLVTPKGSVTSLSMLLTDLGIVRDLTNLDNNFTISKENSGGKDAGEGSSKLIDNNIETKVYLSSVGTSLYWQFEYFEPQIINAYTMTSGNDSPERDPKNWEIVGSDDGQTWTVLDSRIDQAFSSRKLTRTFSFENTKLYKYYRIRITSTNGSANFQLSEFRMLQMPNE
ncbi:discoidin domain-containing protein [Sphingobacterium sp. LRF_L2]|uniref:discoidin domain-containing protein n=1 Tax=Sphingobacterium sp. LRF_L2 TaxID=3369421 RepID=UPI003F5F6178